MADEYAKLVESAHDYAASLRQQVAWIMEGLTSDCGFDLGDVDTEEIENAAAQLEQAAHAITALEAKERETCWLIETARQTYWDGRQVGDAAFFTPKPGDACRFARFNDAEVVRCWLLERTGQVLRSTEHMFLPRSQPPRDKETRT